MKKLKLEFSPNLGEVLTKEELKHVFGGGSGSGSGSESSSCSTSSPLEECGCNGKKIGDKCCYFSSNGEKYEGMCKPLPIFFEQLVCWGD